jgi:ATP-dependent protease ClpP protease subunit
MRFSISLIFLFSINVLADQKVSINGFNFTVKEEISDNTTMIFYHLSENDRKKVCRLDGYCGDKFDKAVNTSESEIFQSTCKSRDLYFSHSYLNRHRWEEEVGRVYVCGNSLEYIIERRIPNINIDKQYSSRIIKVNNLEITQLSEFVGDCNYNYLNFSGPVNQDTTEVIRRLLKTTKRCKDKYSGEEVPIFIFMSSGGGLLKDGFSIGKLFKDNNVNTIVPSGVVCASSCATAFLGGNKRFMKNNSTLLFHAPYKTQRNQYGKVGINCQTNNQDLENHYTQMIGNEDGEFLYERTMDFCSASDGWKINEGAARLFGIID